MKRLERKLNKKKRKKDKAKNDAERKDQIGSGMRGDKVRTYNYRENRIKNHKTGKIVKNIRKVVDQGYIELIQ